MKLVRDLVELASGQATSKVVLFVGFAYLARALGPENYGFVEFAVALSLFATIVVDLGLGAIGTRELTKDPNRVQFLTAAIPTARLITAVIVIPILGFGAELMGQPPQTVTLVWLFSAALLVLPWKQDWLLQGLEKMRFVAIGDVIRAGAFTLGIWLLVGGPEDLARVGIVEIVAAIAATVFYVGFQFFHVGPVRLCFSIGELRGLFAQASLVGLGQVVWAINQYVQLILLAAFVGGEMTAYYGASHRIVGSLLIFSNVYHFNLFPALIRTTLGTTENYDRLIRASFRVVAWGGLFVALFFTFCARPIVELAFGERFGEGATALAILIWALPITTLSGHARQSLVATGRQRQLLYAQMVGMAVTLVATPVLILYYDAVGAAIGMVAANVAVWFAAHAYARVHIGRLPFLASLTRPMLVAAAVSVVCLVLGFSAWLSIPVLVIAGACVPLVDRELIPDLKRLAHAKSGYIVQSQEPT